MNNSRGFIDMKRSDSADGHSPADHPPLLIREILEGERKNIILVATSVSIYLVIIHNNNDNMSTNYPLLSTFYEYSVIVFLFYLFLFLKKATSFNPYKNPLDFPHFKIEQQRLREVHALTQGHKLQ